MRTYEKTSFNTIQKNLLRTVGAEGTFGSRICAIASAISGPSSNASPYSPVAASTANSSSQTKSCGRISRIHRGADTKYPSRDYGISRRNRPLTHCPDEALGSGRGSMISVVTTPRQLCQNKVVPLMPNPSMVDQDRGAGPESETTTNEPKESFG